MHRAGDGIRTHDILLGKQTLCQLSYTRTLHPIIDDPSPTSNRSGRDARARQAARFGRFDKNPSRVYYDLL